MKNNIEDDYCSFEVSKLLKEKGFTWNDWKPFQGIKIEGVPIGLDNAFPCYDENGKEIRPHKYTETNKHYPRPTHNIAIKWIRKNFGIHIISEPISKKLWMWKSLVLKTNASDCDYPFNTHEEAIDAALLQTLNNLI